MAELLRALIVEDSPDDAELVMLALRRGGYAVESRRVDTARALRAALEEAAWDVIVSDFAMPQFSGLDALKIVREKDTDIPFILVSGSIGEDIAVGAMKAGAQDYIMKDRLARLVPAIARELIDAATRRERKRLEEQLRRTQKLEAVGQLASGVAHEFNNILMGISGYAQLLGGQIGLEPEAQQDLDRIRMLATRGGNLSRQLLTFSRAEDGESLVLSIAPLVKSAAKMLRRVLPENMRLEVAADPELGSVRIDPGQLEQILVNLAVNARDAMPDGGELMIEVSNAELEAPAVGASEEVPAGSYVVLAMSDTGSGMDAQTAGRVFEPFYTTKELGKGTGLGLSTVYGIVTQYGGHINVYSESGRGSTFKVYLPRVIEGVPAPDAPIEALAEAVPATGTILVAEDDEPVRNVLETFLGNRGYRVLTAADPEEAEALAREHGREIGLLLTDVTMPKCSGPELYRRLTSVCPAVKVLFISGYFKETSPDLQKIPQEAEFLQKPFSLNDLGSKVNEILAGGEA